jgi:hypothetical protein
MVMANKHIFLAIDTHATCNNGQTVGSSILCAFCAEACQSLLANSHLSIWNGGVSIRESPADTDGSRTE